MDLGDRTALFHDVHLDHPTVGGGAVVVLSRGRHILELVGTTYKAVKKGLNLLTFSESRVAGVFGMSWRVLPSLEDRATVGLPVFFLHGLFMDHFVVHLSITILLGVDAAHVFLDELLLHFHGIVLASKVILCWLHFGGEGRLRHVLLGLHGLFTFHDGASEGRLALDGALLPFRREGSIRQGIG